MTDMKENFSLGDFLESSYQQLNLGRPENELGPGQRYVPQELQTLFNVLKAEAPSPLYFKAKTDLSLEEVNECLELDQVPKRIKKKLLKKMIKKLLKSDEANFDYTQDDRTPDWYAYLIFGLVSDPQVLKKIRLFNEQMFDSFVYIYVLGRNQALEELQERLIKKFPDLGEPDEPDSGTD